MRASRVAGRDCYLQPTMVLPIRGQRKKLRDRGREANGGCNLTRQSMKGGKQTINLRKPDAVVFIRNAKKAKR